MTIPKELTQILSLTNNEKIWIYIIVFFILSYLLISLFTWNFIKPLKYLGIPTTLVGISFLIIRFSSSLLLFVFKTSSQLNLIKTLLPKILKPMLINGLICFIAGIIMLVLYNIINKKIKSNKFTNE